jgi:hypothetical protein
MSDSVSGAFAVLVFASLPAATGVRIKENHLELAPGHFASTDVHWNFEDHALLSAMAKNARVRMTLSGRLATARRRLQAAGKTKLADFYKDTEIDRAIMNAALERDPASPPSCHCSSWNARSLPRPARRR